MDEIYVATDIETDGPSPGHYSMLSFGSVAFQLDRSVVSTFARNLELLPGAKQCPKVMKFWASQPKAWEACRSNTVSPRKAMGDYKQWLESLGAKPVFVAHPVSFDFTFIHWYFHEFIGENPFFIAGLDITSYAMAVLQQRFTESHKSNMPREWVEADSHTHVGLDDAMGHAMVFCNVVAANRAGFRARQTQ
jgi:hypothetical protein